MPLGQAIRSRPPYAHTPMVYDPQFVPTAIHSRNLSWFIIVHGAREIIHLVRPSVCPSAFVEPTLCTTPTARCLQWQDVLMKNFIEFGS